jgi:nucleoside-diphosphate-sugar epimerase
VDRDLDSVNVDAIRGAEIAIHSAALVMEWGPRAKYWQVNVEGTRQVLAACRAAGVQRFVHIGTEAGFADGKSALAGIDESRPLPAHPLPRYPETKAEAERVVLAANSPTMATMVVRPRMIWGDDDTSVLPQIAQAVRDGRFAWIDGGHYLTSTCHVRNVVEGALAAAARGRGGEAYFLTDGAPVEFRAFYTRLLATHGAMPADKSVPRWVALIFATLAEKAWDWLPLAGAPPVTRMAIALGGGEVTVSDAKARRELGYVGRVSVDEGLSALEKSKSA